MKDFKDEIKNTPTSDLLLILEDQLDLYTQDEIEIMREELFSRPDNSLELKGKEQEAELQRKEAILLKKETEIFNNHMLTTGYNFEGYDIKKYIKVISGEVVLGTGFLSEFTASFSDFFGTQSNSFSNKLEQAKNSAMDILIKKSISLGGNAIIGVDFDYINFTGNLIGVVVNGTSVIIDKK